MALRAFRPSCPTCKVGLSLTCFEKNFHNCERNFNDDDDDDGFIAYVVAGVAGPLRLMLWGYIQEEKTL